MKSFNCVWAFTAGLAALGGCAVPLSGFETGHVAPRGHFRVAAGADVSVPLGAISATVDTAKAAAATAMQQPLSDVEKQRLLAAGVNLAYNPPALVTHVGIAYGLPGKFEAGLRFAAGGYMKGGVRRQFVAQEDHGFDFSLGVAVSRAKYEFPINNIIDVLVLDDYKRWAIEIPAMFGKRGDYYRVWFGPRAILWRSSTALHLDLPIPVGGVKPETTLASATASGMILGAQGGLALGYRKVFIGLELTLAQSFGSADLSALNENTQVGLSSFIIYPALAVMGEF